MLILHVISLLSLSLSIYIYIVPILIVKRAWRKHTSNHNTVTCFNSHTDRAFSIALFDTTQHSPPNPKP